MIEDEGKGFAQALPEARIRPQGRWGVASKLWLGFGLLVLILAVSDFVSFGYVRQFERNLSRVVTVMDPLETAVLEMEINAGETARAVLDYVRDLDPIHLEVVVDSEADFESFAARFERLAETDDERRLGRKFAGLYADFKTLGYKIVALADRRHGAVLSFRQAFKVIDGIIDDRLKPSIKGNTSDKAKKKWEAAVALDEVFDEAFASILGYVAWPEPVLRKEVEDAEADFERHLALYRETGLSAEETGWLDRIGNDFAEAVAAGNRIVAITDELNLHLDNLEEHLKTMDAVLDDEIQPLIHGEKVKAAETATRLTAWAAILLLVLGAVGLAVAGVNAWAISRGILEPVRALVSGTKIIGAGALGHRIEIRSRDEFGQLAAAFNRMMENLARALKAAEGARAELERRVDERTAALQDSEARFKDFAEASADWFWEMDAELRYTYLSDHSLEDLHLPTETGIGKTREELAGEAQIAAEPEKWRRHFDDLEARRAIRDFDYTVDGVGGRQREIRINGVPVFDDAGIFRGYRGTGTDVTEQKRAAENKTLLEQQLLQAQKMEAIGQLTGGIAHDFNNLLMVIDGFSRRALTQIGDEEPAAESLARVIQAADYGAGLTRQLLIFGRRQVMETRVVRVAEVVRETQGLLQRSLGEQFELTLEIGDDAVCVETDPGQLRQAIMNLVINARDAMARGGTIVIGVRITELGEDFAARHEDMTAGRHAEVYVKDQGVGIEPENLHHIFEPFFTTKEPGQGTGLGLPMVYGFARHSRGIVDVSSSPGEGATFQIILPIVDREPAAETQDLEETYRGKGETVLLVEDDEALLDLTERTLSDLGYTVLKAKDGCEALQIDAQYDDPIDLVLSDVVMPNLGGFELVQVLRRTRPGIKIVFMSGYPGPGKKRGKDVPKHAVFLRKPLKPHVLAQTVRTVLDRDGLRLAS